MIKGDYLRVLSPRTADGNRPMIGEDGRIIYKETELPMSAKKALDFWNKKLPPHLQKVIEVVRENPLPKQKAVVSEPVSDEVQEIARKKPGPKPKDHAAN